LVKLFALIYILLLLIACNIQGMIACVLNVFLAYPPCGVLLGVLAIVGTIVTIVILL
jgi:hypothetical protein